MAQKLNQSVPLRAPTGSSAGADKMLWEFADLGFDTSKKIWFLQLSDTRNRNVGMYYAREVVLNGGSGIQYQWKDTQDNTFWHVRERFFSDELDGFTLDSRAHLTINFRGEKPSTESIPENYAYLQYAYHLFPDKGPAPKGFVEFCNERGQVVRTLDNKWIVVEDLCRKTTGELPKIRLRVQKRDISHVVVTKSTVIIVGNGLESQR